MLDEELEGNGMGVVGCMTRPRAPSLRVVGRE